MVGERSHSVEVILEGMVESYKTLRGDAEGKLSTEVAEPKLPRKASSKAKGCPYRKPTQVGEERILRRAREPSLRNSAK
jgi:hypothetical protein